MEKPILFSTEMVQAIFAGRKTVTRRIIKPQPRTIGASPNMCNGYKFLNIPGKGPIWDHKPYKIGEVLYVRETWCELYHVDEKGYTHYDNCKYYYKTDGDYQIDLYDDNGFYLDDQKMKWKPSIHMPKVAARIFLRVINIKVERLQDITEMQATKEGFRGDLDMETDTFYPNGYFFVKTWDNIYKDKGYGWETNPFVWVVEFEKIIK